MTLSTTDVTQPIRKRSLFRAWFPVIVLVLAGLALLAVWTWPDENMERGRRAGMSWTIVMASSLLGLIWLLLLSGWQWWLRLGMVLAIGLGIYGSIGNLKFDGDVVPKEIRFRWEKTAAEILEEHRQQQKEGPALPPVAVHAEPATDYPEYRNIRRDGIVNGPGLSRDWQAQPPQLLWRQPVGGGYAGFVVAGNLAVTIEQRGDQEVIAGYDTESGRERWIYSYDALFNEALGGEGPRATPTVAGEDVFALGATGQLTCLKAATGELKWESSVDILANNKNIPWGMSGSPLVYDNVVVVNPGAQVEEAKGRALVAYDRQTGKPIWQAGSFKAAYCSPMLASLAGRRQILIFDAGGLAGHDAANGNELFRFAWPTYQDINVAQPLILPDDRVFISSGYNTGCALLKITEANETFAVKELWRTKAMRCKFTNPVYYEGHIYGLDDGILTCVDVKTGQRIWRDGRYGHGQLVLSGNLLVIQAESGKLVLAEATPAEHRELGSIPVFTEKTWNYLALANGKVYLRNHKEMACFDLTTVKSTGESK